MGSCLLLFSVPQSSGAGFFLSHTVPDPLSSGKNSETVGLEPSVVKPFSLLCGRQGGQTGHARSLWPLLPTGSCWARTRGRGVPWGLPMSDALGGSHVCSVALTPQPVGFLAGMSHCVPLRELLGGSPCASGCSCAEKPCRNTSCTVDPSRRGGTRVSLHLPEGWKQQSWFKSKDAALLRTLISGEVRVGPPAGTRPAQYTWGGVLPPGSLLSTLPF